MTARAKLAAALERAKVRAAHVGYPRPLLASPFEALIAAVGEYLGTAP